MKKFGALMKTRKGRLRVGTSNIVVPGTKATFPVEFQSKSRLCYYSTIFNTLEVNSSFRKIPLPLTLIKWANEVGEDFQFTLKLSGEISHVRKLKTDLLNVDRFIAAANHLTVKNGCLLLQFPGSITMDYFSEVESILSRIHEMKSDKWRVAVELRSDTWYCGETFEMLNEYDASLVLHDMKKGYNDQVNSNAKFIYYRFHGPKGDYRGTYDNGFLMGKATDMTEYLTKGLDVYVYFNNTMGDAFNNALTLKKNILNIFS